MHNEVKTSPILCLPDWENVYRIIPSHFPPINLFEEVTDVADLDIVFAIESLTNDRLLEEAGDLKLVPKNQRLCGVGSSPIMAAFTHIGIPSRFTDGKNYGVYYGAKELKTAIKETVYHREIFMRQTSEPDTELSMRCYTNNIALPMHDIRAEEFSYLHTDEYVPSQQFASMIRALDSNGFIYNSVRDEKGECVAAFKPIALTIPIQAGHYKYQWHSVKNCITNVLKIEKIEF